MGLRMGLQEGPKGVERWRGGEERGGKGRAVMTGICKTAIWNF